MDASDDDYPDHIVERAEYAYNDWTEITPVNDYLGFYEEPTEPIPYSPTGHRDEVFENELDYMTPVAADLVTELVGGDVVITEMPYGGQYRTDLAICEIDAEALARRLQITNGDGRSLVDEWKYLKSYRALQRGDPVTREEWATDGPYSNPTTNRKVWDRLDDMGLLVTTSGIGVTVNLPISVTAHAVELKQRDWETALEQARRANDPAQHVDAFRFETDPRKYGYADFAWVVMDAGHVDEAYAHREEFERYGVGLISLDEGSAVKLVDAQQQHVYQQSLDRQHVNEKAIEKIDVDDDGEVSGSGRQALLREVTTG